MSKADIAADAIQLWSAVPYFARLARLLVEQAQEGVLQRHHWTTQAQMAARLGTVPDVVNRALQKLANDGLIRVSRHQIVILDREGLQEVAGFNV